MTEFPTLYSFRRCPYAMRARLALLYAGQRCELREVLLRDKPAEMLALSPKGTVPVLHLADGAVIDQSYDIVKWAISQHDPQNWRAHLDQTDLLVRDNDGPFKSALDKYKYASRFPDRPPESYRAEGEFFLRKLDQMLRGQPFLLGDRQTVADIVLFPFVRQFAHVDRDWFFSTPYARLQQWLRRHLDSGDFKAVMKKYPQWREGNDRIFFPEPPAVPSLAGQHS